MRVLTREVLGRKFYCLADQSAPDMDIAALEKRRCNDIVSRSGKFARALDAFAGVGVSSRYWSRCARELYLVEYRPDALRLLRRNLPSIRRRGCRVSVIGTTAEKFIKEAIRKELTFDLVDCDPFGSCYELFPLISQLILRGVVCVTTGEIFQVYRGLNRRPGRPPAHEFRGRKVSGWVLQMLIPELLSFFTGAKLVHFYLYPSSVRVIFTVGGFRLPLEPFSDRPRFLGWLGQEPPAPSPQGPVLGVERTES